MPLISVIVPVYKTRMYVEKCLLSIMNQTLDDIEILCVNDCTPDNSFDVVKALASSDSRIRLIEHEKNLGLGGARNTGIKAAQSQYIASVDSDDWIAPDMLEALWKGTQSGYFDVVVCGYVSVDEDGTVLSRHMRSQKTVDPISPEHNPFRLSNPSFWNKLWRKSLFINNNIFFPNHIYYQDSATTPRIYKKARNINFIGGEYYKYLIRSDSVTNSVSDKHIVDKFRELGVVKEFFISNDIYDNHKIHFEERIFNSFRYHTENVVNNNSLGDEGTDEYLRMLLLMREALLVFDDRIRDLSLRDKASTLLSNKRLPEVHNKKLRINSTQAPRLPNKNPRILVLTLYSGENEFESSKEWLKRQHYQNWEHKIFSYMGNAEAHHALYSEIMSRKSEFDIFIKLDADMVFYDEDVLGDIVDLFYKTADLDHLVIGCRDFMTGKNIIGIHSYSRRVNWDLNPDGIFLDPNPSLVGRRKIIEKPKKPVVLHSPDPSPFQAFHFGAHRALKLTQKGRPADRKRKEAMLTQWDVLYHVWEQSARLGDRRHALALVAADMVINDEIGEGAHDYRDPSLRSAYSTVEALEDNGLVARFERHWATKASRRRYFEAAVGIEGLKKLGQTSYSASAGSPKPINDAGNFREIYHAGRKLLKEGRYSEAHAKLCVALRLKPESKLARIGIAESLLGLGRLDEARTLYLQLAELYPTDLKLSDRASKLGRSSIAIRPKAPEPLLTRM